MSRMTAREVAQLANVIFAQDSNLLMFNSLFDIASGDMIEEVIEGTLDPDAPPGHPQALSTLGLMDGAMAFGSFSIGPDGLEPDDATELLREALGKLNVTEAADMDAILPLLASDIRTVAAIGISVDGAGNRLVRYWRHPDLDPVQAAANLIENFDEAHAQTDDDGSVDVDLDDYGPDDEDPDGGGLKN